jgi:hypothetical protein
MCIAYPFSLVVEQIGYGGLLGSSNCQNPKYYSSHSLLSIFSQFSLNLPLISLKHSITVRYCYINLDKKLHFYPSVVDAFRTPHLQKSVRDRCRSGSLRNLDDALGLFDRMLHIHPLPSLMDFTQLLTAIARMKHHSTVITLIKEMQLSGITPDIYIPIVLIKCF